MKAPWKVTREMFLAEAEAERLLTALRTAVDQSTNENRSAAVTDQLIIESLLFSGLRTTEFCRLTVGDTIVGHKESAFVVRGTPRQDRTVAVPSHVSRLVREFVASVRPELLPGDVRADDLTQTLIFNERRKPYERTGLYRRVVRILTTAGLGKRASVQLLRHTYGYLAYKRTGGNLLFVQRQLGHAHPMVTSVYAEFVEHSYAKLANLVAGEKS